MSRVLICAALLALGCLLAGGRSAAPPRSTRPAASSIHKTPLVDRLYQEVDFPGLDDPKTTLAEVLDKLAKDYRVTLRLNEQAFKYEMLPEVERTAVAEFDPIPAMKARLGEVLQVVLRRVRISCGATWLLRRDHIEITTWRVATAEIRDKGNVSPLEGDLIYRDSRPRPLVQIDLDSKPLSSALACVADRAGWNVVLDPATGKEVGASAVSARLRNVPVDTAVLLLASQAGLGMAEVDNVLYVTTQEKATALAKRHAELRPSPRKPDAELRPPPRKPAKK
jgi:hypothetical protein